MPTSGKFNLKFKIGDREVNHHFYRVRNLGEDVILGIDFIHRYKLNYDTQTRNFFWKGGPSWSNGILKVNKLSTLKEFTMSFIQCQIRTESGALPTPGVP